MPVGVRACVRACVCFEAILRVCHRGQQYDKGGCIWSGRERVFILTRQTIERRRKDRSKRGQNIRVSDHTRPYNPHRPLVSPPPPPSLPPSASLYLSLSGRGLSAWISTLADTSHHLPLIPLPPDPLAIDLPLLHTPLDTHPLRAIVHRLTIAIAIPYLRNVLTHSHLILHRIIPSSSLPLVIPAAHQPHR